jgi:hypothetical protein
MATSVNVIDSDVTIETVSIPDGATEPTAGISLGGKTLVGVSVAAGLEGTSLGLKVATTLAGTYLTMNDGAGAVYTKTIATPGYTPINPADVAGVRYLKPVVATQTGAVELDLHLRTV